VEAEESVPVVHSLELHYERVLTQDEWRTIVNAVHGLPIRPVYCEGHSREKENPLIPFDPENPPACLHCGCDGMKHPAANGHVPQGKECECGRCPGYDPRRDEATSPEQPQAEQPKQSPCLEPSGTTGPADAHRAAGRREAVEWFMAQDYRPSPDEIEAWLMAGPADAGSHDEPFYRYSGWVSAPFWRWVGTLDEERRNKAYELGCQIQELECELHNLTASAHRADAGSHETLRAKAEQVALSFAGWSDGSPCRCAEIDFTDWPVDIRPACGWCRRVDIIEAALSAVSCQPSAASASAPAVPREVGGAAPTSTPLDKVQQRIEARLLRLRELNPRHHESLTAILVDVRLLAASPASALVTRTERLDDLRTIARFAMTYGDDDVENAGIRLMLALDHPELLAASPASALVAPRKDNT
jgi:hypothetical protein